MGIGSGFWVECMWYYFTASSPVVSVLLYGVEEGDDDDFTHPQETESNSEFIVLYDTKGKWYA